jgi:hypothetical protein
MPAQAYIKCSKCGDLKGTRNDRLEDLIKKFGSKEELEKKYTCRSCTNGVPVGDRPAKIANKKTKKTKKEKQEKKKKLPKSKLICCKCNGEFKTTPKQMNKLIGKFGSLEVLQTTYVCRKCRKALNVTVNGRMKKEKRKRKVTTLQRDETGSIVLPEHMKKFVPRGIEFLTDEEYASSTACWRPDIWAKQKCCNGCAFFEKRCGCADKHLDDGSNKKKAPKQTKQDEQVDGTVVPTEKKKRGRPRKVK